MHGACVGGHGCGLDLCWDGVVSRMVECVGDDVQGSFVFWLGSTPIFDVEFFCGH